MTRIDSFSRPKTLAVIIWSNLLRQQYLQRMSDKELCSILDITPRTLYNYQRDPSALTLGQIQNVLDNLDIDINALLIE